MITDVLPYMSQGLAGLVVVYAIIREVWPARKKDSTKDLEASLKGFRQTVDEFRWAVHENGGFIKQLDNAVSSLTERDKEYMNRIVEIFKESGGVNQALAATLVDLRLAVAENRGKIESACKDIDRACQDIKILRDKVN